MAQLGETVCYLFLRFIVTIQTNRYHSHFTDIFKIRANGCEIDSGHSVISYYQVKCFGLKAKVTVSDPVNKHCISAFTQRYITSPGRNKFLLYANVLFLQNKK